MKKAFLTAALGFCCARLFSAEPAGIWFLHFQLTNNHVVLLEQKRVPGVLKERRAEKPARGLQIELLSDAGGSLWKTVIADPSIRRLEYENPEQPGKMKTREVVITNAEFTVRAPFHPQAATAAFTRSRPSHKAGEAAQREDLGRVSLARKDP